MKLCKLLKDGGPLSRSWAYFLIEWKSLFSIALLRFEDGSREAFHTHAFNAVSWLLKGELVEFDINGAVTIYRPSLCPIYTPRDKFHKVVSVGRSWALTFRGPWIARWREYLPENKEYVTLTHGRKECQ